MALVLSESVRRSIANELQPLLSRVLDLTLTLKHAHWNIRGGGFRPLHLHLDEIVEMTREFSDEIAERIVALDAPADGRTATIANESGLDPISGGFIGCQDAIAHLVESFDQTIALARDAQSALAEIDAVTEDLVIEVLRGLAKQRWMLAAEIDESGAS